MEKARSVATFVSRKEVSGPRSGAGDDGSEEIILTGLTKLSLLGLRGRRVVPDSAEFESGVKVDEDRAWLAEDGIIDGTTTRPTGRRSVGATRPPLETNTPRPFRAIDSAIGMRRGGGGMYNVQ